MSADSSFRVYEHWRSDKMECFYVGISANGWRAHDMRRRNPHHRAIQKKLKRLGFAVGVRVVSAGLTKEEAYSEEMRRIAMYGRAQLANLTAGGDGVRELSAESRKKMSEARLRRSTKPETREKISLALRGRVFTEASRKKLSSAKVGHVVSAEVRLRLSEKAGRPVVRLNDGRWFPSGKAAAAHIGVTQAAVSYHLTKGTKSCKGHVFAFEEAA